MGMNEGGEGAFEGCCSGVCWNYDISECNHRAHTTTIGYGQEDFDRLIAGGMQTTESGVRAIQWAEVACMSQLRIMRVHMSGKKTEHPRLGWLRHELMRMTFLVQCIEATVWPKISQPRMFVEQLMGQMEQWRLEAEHLEVLLMRDEEMLRAALRAKAAMIRQLNHVLTSLKG